MKKVIVVTGASSGFGALAARALAKAGHVVYASMRDTSGRNKGQVQEATKFAADNKADLRTVELDVLSDTSANIRSRRSSMTTVWMWWCTTPVTWCSVRSKRSPRNSSPNSMT